VRFLTVEFEELRQQRNYRTPWKLNYFVTLFGHYAPIFFAPMFATVGCKDRNPARFKTEDGQTCGFGTPGAYLSMAFFTLVLSALLTVVMSLEDPFVLDGADDVICQFALEGGALHDVIQDGAIGVANPAMGQVVEDDECHVAAGVLV